MLIDAPEAGGALRGAWELQVIGVQFVCVAGEFELWVGNAGMLEVFVKDILKGIYSDIKKGTRYII